MYYRKDKNCVPILIILKLSFKSNKNCIVRIFLKVTKHFQEFLYF